MNCTGTIQRLTILLLLNLPVAYRAGAQDTAAAQRLFNDLRFIEAARMYEKLVRATPDDGRLLANMARAYRYADSLPRALDAARRALALNDCNARAHSVAARCMNPQSSTLPDADADSAWYHLQRAVACDAREYDAWLDIVNESQHRGDSAALQRALGVLKADGFFTPATLAWGRWVLGALPPRAVLLTYGDLDTYTALCLQATEGVRPDVAVLNYTMLQLPWYARAARDRCGLPLPVEERDLEGFGSSDPPERRHVYGSHRMALHQAIVAYWGTGARRGELARPLAAVHTGSADELAAGHTSWLLMGPYYLAIRAREGPSLDTAAVRAALASLRPADIGGRYASVVDESPYRRTAGSPAHDVCWVALEYARFQHDSHVAAAARWGLSRAEELFAAGGPNAQVEAMIDDLRKAMRPRRPR